MISVGPPPGPAGRPERVRVGVIVALTLVIVAAIVLMWLGPMLIDGDRENSQPSNAPPTTSSSDIWGPLAVVPPQDGMDTARGEGTMRVTGECVFLVQPQLDLLIWPADQTAWDPEARSITFINVDGSLVSVGDGDRVVFGGGGDSAADGGVSGEEMIASMTWVTRPDPACPSASWWSVGSVQKVEQ